jgi:hypothetical protein
MLWKKTMATPLSSSYKLPRQLLSNPKAEGLLDQLYTRTRKLHEDSMIYVPVLELNTSLKKALLTARKAGHAVRGFDNASELLIREQDGINKLIKQNGQGDRISRLVLMSNDGAAGFYNKVNHLLVKHSPRVLGCIVDADSYALGSLLFGEGKIAKLVLVDHKAFVSQVLMSIKETT